MCHFHPHSICHNSVTWPYLAARVATKCNLAVYPRRKDRGYWWSLTAISESSEHCVFASFSRAVIWVWEFSSQGTFLKLLRILSLFLNKTSRNILYCALQFPHQFLSNFFFCLSSLFLCVHWAISNLRVNPQSLILHLTSGLACYLQSFTSLWP